jgi:hypothetical protein
MDAVFSSLLQLVTAVWQLLIALIFVVTPWTPLIGYLAFWLFAVDWVKFRLVLIRGGIIGVLLIVLMTTLVWGLIAPPVGDYHNIFGLQLSNFVGKFVYVAALTVMMFLCGSVQLSGLCGSWAQFPEDAPADDHHGHDDHAHDDADHAVAHAH